MIIQKEQLSGVTFKTSKSQSTAQERSEMMRKLFHAMLLGNTYKSKVKITFNTEQGPKMVESTVWAKTDDMIVFKGGNYIPISSIYFVDLT